MHPHLPRVARLALAAGLTVGAVRPSPAQPRANAVPPRPVPSPREVLGFAVGADRTLADWTQITGYFATLASASPSVKVDTLGLTTQRRPFIVATITSPGNRRRLEEIRRAQALLADPRRLTPAAEARLAASQPAVVLISCNIHATEIAASQMAMELAHRLATNDTLQRALEHVVVLLVPSMNPDGQDMITKWYREGLGTRWEGGPLPWLYHHYVGHDNNRDWFMVTQVETKLVTDLLYRRWFPEVFYDVHQMGNGGARIFVPPMVDPINPNLDPLIVRGIGQIGAEMAMALEERGKRGVADGVIYDLWWHGGARSTPTRHNMIGVITEAASVRIATPIDQKPEELVGHSRGLPKYERRMNFPNPWPGGRWTLRDIVDYELIASEALVRLAASHRERYVRNFVELGRRQLRLGATEKPYAYVIPRAQHDPSAVAKLVETLRVGGVEVDSAPGAFTISMAQPYRAHVKDLLEPQRFPKQERWPGGPTERPYDVAGWTLPLQLGVRVVPVDTPVTRAGLRAMAARQPAPALPCAGDPRNTRSYAWRMRALLVSMPGAEPGTRACPAAAPPPTPTAPVVMRIPRIGLYKPWTANMDEGWTRWLLEQFAIRYASVTDSAIKAGGLGDQLDVLLIPDMSLREARDGQSAASVPPRYAGGLGEAGLAELKRFVDGGGTLVTLDRASEIATSALGVAVTRITVPPRLDDAYDDDFASGSDSARALREPLYAPGSIFRALVDASHPVGRGMPDTAAVYFTNSTTFDLPFGSPARVIARYPANPDDILLSGYLQGARRIAGKAAAVDVPVGRGRVIMFGFRPQYRGQSYGTFRMLFNALLDGAPAAAPGAERRVP